MLPWVKSVLALVVGAAVVAGGSAEAESGVAQPVAVKATTPVIRGVPVITGVPIIIGHRGASGYRPEHTLAAYELAMEMGADYIEPDLVSTKDGVLVARHENEIGGTTNVAAHPEFAHLKTTKTIDGKAITGWFTEDFTLAQLKTLQARERIPKLRPQNTAYNNRFTIPTLQEVIELVARKNRELAASPSGAGRQIGICPETKHPTYFDSIGLSLEEPLVETLHRNGYRTRDDLVFIQSFEVANLKKLRGLTPVRLLQLVDASGRPYDFEASGNKRRYADLLTPAGLAEMKSYADGIGVHKNLIVPRDNGNRLLPPTTLIQNAHAAGLTVHAWTFRSENSFLPAEYRAGESPAARGDAEREYRVFYNAGLDGVFSDQPDIAVAARKGFTVAALHR